MTSFACPRGCCTLKIASYTDVPSEDFNETQYYSRKAGVVLYDPRQEKVLLVQSRGHLWGPPKGTLKCGETHRTCAVREVEEETGIRVEIDSFMKAINLANRATYFYTEVEESDVEVQTQIVDNDANGVGWISLRCLGESIERGNITLSKHCQLVLRRLFNVTFTHPVFTLVQRKGRKKKV